ncbi:MAG: DUF1906 domain-containing protein [Lactobacillus sp.]|nr:DUF1906 domain-containing protein [Lactobacillus sp.]
MADQAVLDVQKWLNATYQGVSGFEKAPENGHTGWATIYSLREGLQHELGITNIGQGFGDATKAAAANVVGTLKAGYNGNISKLIQGAFWCKGINPGNFSTAYTVATVNAVKELQGDAGLTQDGQVTVSLLAALFDMSAFVLVANGDPKVRLMQQALNRKYATELQSVMPCDGIYQRATNTALIYALQRTAGFSAAAANGEYDRPTINATPTVQPGTNSDLVQVIQYGLYVNGFYSTGAFDGYFNADVSSAVIAFRRFMNLPPFTSTADLTVIKGLLTSNGNTDRDSDTLDAATQLSSNQAATLAQYDFKIIGRYLTGSVGTGAAKQDKNLTPGELQNLTQAGFSVVPIYEDGGFEIEYFTYAQGLKDGAIATSAAASLGFPATSTIYFAVDVDILDGDIDNTVIPYFQGITQAMNHSIYTIGIYGTRNVCNRVSADSGTQILYSYVADMSYGWSGNLGFKMPKNWAFDQFVEYKIANIGIDQVASSGRDKGATSFAVDNTAVRLDFARTAINSMYQLKPVQPLLGGLEVDSPALHVSTLLAEYYVTLSSSFSGDISGAPIGFTVKDGKVTTQFQDEIEKFKTLHAAAKDFDFLSGLNVLAPTVGNGTIRTGLSAKDGMLGFKIILDATQTVMHNGIQDTIDTRLTIDIFSHPNGLGVATPDFDAIYKPVSENNPDLSWVSNILVAGALVFVIIAVVGGVAIGAAGLLGAGLMAL